MSQVKKLRDTFEIGLFEEIIVKVDPASSIWHLNNYNDYKFS